MDRFPVPRFLVGRPVLVGTVVFVLVVAVAAASALVGLRRESEMEIQPDMRSEPSIKQEATASSGEAKPTLLPLDADDPSNAQLQALLQAWLDRKAKVLSGGSGVDAEVAVVARDGLVQQVEAERRADAARNERQDVEATISSMEVVSRAPRRIELRAQVAYRDQRLDAAGKVIDRTAPTILPVTYILGRDGSTWRLQAFIPG
jgi:predicted RND superfamily exporter protein